MAVVGLGDQADYAKWISASGAPMPYEMVYATKYKNRNTFLVLYYEKTGGYSLTDFSATDGYVIVENTQTRGCSLAQLQQQITHRESVPSGFRNRDTKDGYADYHKHTWKVNRERLRPACPCPTCQGQAKLTP
jgi:hypothetical protein